MKPNGEYGCSIKDSWEEFLPKAEQALTKVEEQSLSMDKLVANSDRLVTGLNIISDKLLDAATSGKAIPIPTMDKITETHNSVIKILGVVIVCLMFVIVFLLTGVKLGLIQSLQ